jgi:hypothetical protein
MSFTIKELEAKKMAELKNIAEDMKLVVEGNKRKKKTFIDAIYYFPEKGPWSTPKTSAQKGPPPSPELSDEEVDEEDDAAGRRARASPRRAQKVDDALCDALEALHVALDAHRSSSRR